MGKASRHKAIRREEGAIAQSREERSRHFNRWALFYAAFILVSVVILPALYNKYGNEFLEKSSQTESKEKRMITIETTKGTIKAELYPDKAPKTVAQITQLIATGFYDGLTFHRVEPGFVVQGGDPKGDGTGGYDKNIPFEENDLKHERGVLAMARSQDKDSASSQFYITLAPQPSLDGSYVVFGKVISGMEFVDQIVVGDKMTKVTAE